MRAIIAVLFLFSHSFSQQSDSSQVVPDVENGSIKASVQFDLKEVPQNRHINYAVKISWQGDLDRFEIEKLETPVATNFEIIQNSSSNWVGQTGGVSQAIKTYEFTLQPQELGMAYVDGMIIEYVDMLSGKKGHLLTNRLDAKVIDPIRERSWRPWIYGGTGLLLLLIFSGAGLQIAKRKKAKEAEEKAKALESIPIEESYLSDLREKVDLKSGKLVEVCSSLSKIFRSYLAERYNISARGMTTKEISAELSNLAAPESIVEKTEEALRVCDEAKFSGGQVEKAVIERAYTLVEDVLTYNKAASAEVPGGTDEA